MVSDLHCPQCDETLVERFRAWLAVASILAAFLGGIFTATMMRFDLTTCEVDTDQHATAPGHTRLRCRAEDGEVYFVERPKTGYRHQ